MTRRYRGWISMTAGVATLGVAFGIGLDRPPYLFVVVMAALAVLSAVAVRFTVESVTAPSGVTHVTFIRR